MVMKKNDFLLLRIFSIHEILKKEHKMAGAKKVAKVENQSTMQRNFWNLFILMPYFWNVFQNFEEIFLSFVELFQKIFGSNHYKWLDI